MLFITTLKALAPELAPTARPELKKVPFRVIVPVWLASPRVTVPRAVVDPTKPDTEITPPLLNRVKA